MLLGDSMKLDAVLKAVDDNIELTDEMKDNFKELITIFNSFFPMVDLTNLKNRN